MHIGEKIRAARKLRGYTLVELGKLIDVSNAALSQIETGKTEPSRKTLIALAKVLKSDFGLEWLKESVENTPSPALSKKEIARDLSAQDLISLKFGAGSGRRTSAETRALAKLLDEAIAKDERVLGPPDEEGDDKD